MEFKLSNTIKDFIKIITKTAQANNVRVFFVGGMVRDNYLNREIKDVDLIVDTNAIELSKKLPDSIKIKSIHEDFATVKLEYNNIDIDLASTRSEKYPYSGCLPVVDKIGIDISQDVKRRDFTVNSLYAEIKIKNDDLNCEVIDLVGGISDINKKTLKSLHNNTYIDDPSRIFRGLDFKYRFDFDFSSEDKKLINQYLENINIENASVDRIVSVAKKTLSSEFQDEIFSEIIEKKYYKVINNEDIEPDISRIENLTKKFSLNKTQKAQLYIDILMSNKPEIPDISDEVMKYKFYSKLDCVSKTLLFYFYPDYCKNEYLNIKINTSGKDLIECGYSQGKQLGIILDKILEKKLANPKLFMTLEEELDWVKKNFPQN